MEDFPADDGSSEMDQGKDPLQPEGVEVVVKYEYGNVTERGTLTLYIVRDKTPYYKWRVQ